MTGSSNRFNPKNFGWASAVISGFDGEISRTAEPPKRRTVEASTRCAFFAESLEEKNLITSYQEKEL
ncbi:MAG: hypothetical protein DWQ51_12505 [Microcystis wesenbergii TW10]|jgi:hypothetical protein|uniref:Uncharacterized protein n=1 Tax=Microcystis wesenbergii TW10 TaxID=2060474 RepID=A0A3E0LWR6_9CHRO|nr:hypothetical protein [Burkholderiales bacterium]REJ51858.1 MAG: hypothetical protein DWQ51_12505 [Microcystis wesenbergii TW10]